MAIRIQEAASVRLDEIYRYTRDTVGRGAGRNLHHRLVRRLRADRNTRCHSRPVPAEFGVEGYFFRYERHFVYWRQLSNGDIGIVTILHERMHQIDRFKEDFG